MTAVLTHLPKEPLVTPEDLVEAIIDTNFPCLEYTSGMDSVLSAKVYLNNEWIPFALTQNYKDELVKILDQLPPLHGRMMGSEVVHFMRRFKALLPNARWEPCIVDDYARYVRHDRRAFYRHKYFLELQRSVAEGKTLAMSRDNFHCHVLDIGAMISYQEALKYLASIGLLLGEKVAPIAAEAESSSPQSEDVRTEENPADSFETVQPADALATETAAQSEVGSSNTSDAIPPSDLDISADSHSTHVDSLHAPNHSSADPVTSNLENNDQTSASDDRFIRLKEIMDRTGFGKTKIYSMMDVNSPYHDPDFPKNVRISANSSASVWSLNAFMRWQKLKLKGID
jgi:prophage regulatory protein